MKRKKVTDPKPTPAPTLRLDPGMVLSEPCLVTDKFGKAWWVNPLSRSAQPVDG